MKQILKVIFPKEINNTFRGYKVALYLFYALTAVTLWRSQHHLFAADGGAQSIATIPLDTFTTSGAQAVIGIFSLWGLSQLIIGFIYLITSIRYRAMVPLMYLLMFFEYLVRATYIPAFKSIPTDGTAPGALINIPFILFTLVMLILCVVGDRKKTILQRKSK
ncbi:MAG: hypothetical protein OCD02_06655 [Spirochaetaceae bacterium]